MLMNGGVSWLTHREIVIAFDKQLVSRFSRSHL